MDDADAQRAVLEAEALHDLDGVVVAVPHREAELAEPRRCFLWWERVVRDRERRHASFHRRRAVQPPWGPEPFEEVLPQLTFVLGHELPADVLEVLDSRDEACEQLVRERAGLVAARDREVGGGPHLVRPPRLEQ